MPKPETAPRVRMLPVASLKPNPHNARRHSADQVEKLAAAFREFGFRGVILVNPDRIVLVGHGRLEAAKLAGLRKVPTITVDDMTPERQRAFMIADNRLGELSTWDEPALQAELRALLPSDVNLPAIGYTLTELDTMLKEPEQKAERGKLSMDVKAVCPRCGHTFTHK